MFYATKGWLGATKLPGLPCTGPLLCSWTRAGTPSNYEVAMTILRRALGWIAHNAALLTAISSIIIAALSLRYAIEAQQRDYEYKELSIQPRLILGGDADAFALSIENDGLGPALIWRIEVVVNGVCETTDGKSQADWGDIFYKFGQEQQKKMYTEPFAGTPVVKKGKTSALEIVNTLYPGDVVPVGKKRTLVTMDQTQSKFLQEIDRTLLTKIQTKFMAAAYAAPIRITVCSLSGRSCGPVGNADQCGKVIKLPRHARPIRPEGEFEN